MADPQAILKTNRGDITVNLFPNHAPETVANFTGLATAPSPTTPATAAPARSTTASPSTGSSTAS